MESASSGAEQFMFRTGQLREESNIFWSLEFKNFHGLRSVANIPFVSVDTVACNRFSPSQYEEYFNLIEYLKPIMRDTTSFHLISMMMLLDSSNITADCSVSTAQTTGANMDCEDLSQNHRATIEKRFQDIKAIQKHYSNLFYNHFVERKRKASTHFGGTEEEINKIIYSIKKLSKLISVLFQ